MYPKHTYLYNERKKSDVAMKERGRKKKTEAVRDRELKTCGEQRLAEAGVPRSYSPLKKTGFKAGFVRFSLDTVDIDTRRLEEKSSQT